MSASTSVIPRATIYEIEAAREATINLYAEAFDALRKAEQAAGKAYAHGALTEDARELILPKWGTPDRDKFLSATTRQVDRKVWAHLIGSIGLERLMDKTARDQFREQLNKEPPPATADNCFATLEQLIGDADMIFKRGVAEAFCKLDRRFRSHDGFKIGGRIILDGAFSGGWWNHWRNHDETLRDVERAFRVLDGKPQPERSGGIIGTVDLSRPKTFEASAFVAEDDLFRVRVFQNGNAHVWFKRDDLTDKVNQLLADYYGAAIGASPDVAEKTHQPNRSPAKHFGFFETPQGVLDRMMHTAACRLGHRVLEPSAGRGRIAKAARSAGAVVECVELQPDNVRELRTQGFDTTHGDFFDRKPRPDFDRVLMNPPFDRGRDVDHVSHALKFLRPGGRLVAVMSASTEFREDRKTVAFRTLVERLGGRFQDLPAGSFQETGTMVNTLLLTVQVAA